MFASNFLSAEFTLIFFLWTLQLGFPATPDNNEEVESKDGFLLFGGDIILTKEQAKALSVDQSLATTARLSRAVLTVESKKWPGGVVPYTMSTSFNDSAKDVILAAMQQIRRDSDLSIFFRVARPTDDSFIHFFQGNGCYSNVGRLGGQQNISISSLCTTTGLIMHEILHALGRWHEHSRPDRDSFVVVKTENIKEGFQDNFKIVEDGETSTQGMAYDFDSVMHYDAYAFSSNHRPTITPLDRTVRLGRLGQRRLLSSTDIAHLKAMYPKESSEWSRWSSWSTCSRTCGAGVRSRSRTCIDKTGPCTGSATQQDSCNKEACPSVVDEWDPWSPWSGCSRSCGKGQRSRFRVCRLASHQDCKGSRLDVGECTIRPCPEDSEWTPWSSWSSCSPAFNGTRQRTRQCRRVSSKSVLESVHCRGVAKEVESCPPFLCTESYNRSACDGCLTGSCLSGVRRLGCHQIPFDDFNEFRIIDTTDLIAASEGSSDEMLHYCGKEARALNHVIFALNRTNCVVGLQDSNNLDKCNEKENSAAFQMYSIFDKEDFDLSLRAYDSCGSNFCLANNGSLLSSSASPTQIHLFMAFSFILWSL